MMQKWIEEGTPSVFWLSGFFFTHGFLTAVKQNFARRHKMAIDGIGFDFEWRSETVEQLSSPPEDGVYVHGMFLEGARFDQISGVLAEQTPKQLTEATPVLWLKTDVVADMVAFPHYNCPMYRESSRRGQLKTTGQ